MPGFFKDIEGEGVVLMQGGVFKQTTLATKDGYLFAKSSGGYIRIMEDGSTSKAGVAVDFLSFQGGLASRLGRLCLPDTAGAKALAPPKMAKLLGAPDADT